MNNISPLAVIEPTVQLGNNVTVAPFVVLRGNTVIRDNVVVESFSTVVDSTIGKGTVVVSSNVKGTVVGCNCQIGPFAHLRQGTVVQDNCRVGNFVETKNTTLGRGTKASHLAYLGDATFGEYCNVGCGVIVVNYDGTAKHNTTVGNNVFVGCNSNLIAPVTIGDDVFVACATTVDGDLPNGCMAIGRVRQQTKPNYPHKYTKRPQK